MSELQTAYPGFDEAVRFWRHWDSDPDADMKYGAYDGGEVIASTLVNNGYELAHAYHIATVARRYTIDPMAYYPGAQ